MRSTTSNPEARNSRASEPAEKYEQFAKPLDDLRAHRRNGAKDASPECDAIASSKLEDFTSRLRGYLDVQGLDLGSDPDMTLLKKLRRALVLRSLLEQRAEPIFVKIKDGKAVAQIDRVVVRAFLNHPKYFFGVRSMEAIIQMSRWVDGWFVPASLPSVDQLKMHAEGEFLGAGR